LGPSLQLAKIPSTAENQLAPLHRQSMQQLGDLSVALRLLEEAHDARNDLMLGDEQIPHSSIITLIAIAG